MVTWNRRRSIIRRRRGRCTRARRERVDPPKGCRMSLDFFARGVIQRSRIRSTRVTNEHGKNLTMSFRGELGVKLEVLFARISYKNKPRVAE